MNKRFSNVNKRLSVQVINKNKSALRMSSNKIISKNNKEKRHSSIFSTEGLNAIALKYNFLKLDNKSLNTEEQMINSKSKSNKSRNKNDSNSSTSLTKLRELNNNMDMILTGMKDNLQNITINSEKKIINAEKFINQFNKKNDKNYLLYDINSNDSEKDNNESSSIGFSFLSISNFSFSIINKYLIYDNKLSEEQKIKLKYIFDDKDFNSKSDIKLDEIIQHLYNYKNKYDNIKNSNKTKYNDNYINEFSKKFFEVKKYEYENSIIKDEINFLKESLTKSLYNGEMLLDRIYDKLNQFDFKIQNNIDDISDDILKKD